MPLFTIQTEKVVIRTYEVAASSLEEAVMMVLNEEPQVPPVKEEDGGETLRSIS